jgi:hypothetical protein
VVPILVYGATMPRTSDLPDNLAGLVRRRALEISVNRFDAEFARLLTVQEWEGRGQRARR